MHRPTVSIAAAVVLAATLVACGGSDGDSGGGWPAKPAGPSDVAEPGTDPGAEPGGEQMPEAAPSSSRPAVARLGDTLTLEGNYGSGDVRADITLNRFEDRAEPELEVSTPPPGYRLVAVEFTIVSTGAFSTGRITTRWIARPPANEITIVEANASQYGTSHWTSCQAM